MNISLDDEIKFHDLNSQWKKKNNQAAKGFLNSLFARPTPKKDY